MFKITENEKTYTKKDFFETFDGSRGLFEACWKEFMACSWNYDSVDEIKAALEQSASYRVNNPRSNYYMFG